MLSTSMIKLGNRFRYIKRKFGDDGIKIVTNHVIFDKWTKDNQIIELLGKILEKKGQGIERALDPFFKPRRVFDPEDQ